MSDIPATHYALSEGYHLAYQVFGDGPPDLIVVQSGPGSHVEFQWQLPAVNRLLRRLAGFSRVICFDGRGVGLSDPVMPDRVPTLEDQVEDLVNVLDDVGSERAVLLSNLAGAMPAAVFAATHPGRVESLVMFAPWARTRRGEDYPIGYPDEVVDSLGAVTRDSWGKGELLRFFTRAGEEDRALREWYGQIERLAASPGTAAAMAGQWFDTDVRAILPSVQVPTLVLARADQPMPPASFSKYVAESIPGARYLEFAGSDSLSFVGDSEPLLDAIEDFVTGGHRRSQPRRVLATVLFVDIVNSTVRAAEVGDTRWRDILTNFYGLVERQLGRFEGRLVDTAGDGVLAVFDGAGRAIEAASAIRDAVRALDLEVRAGVHTGEMEHMPGGGVGGIAVHIGARVAALAGPGEVLVSRTVRDLVVGSRFALTTQGEHELKGVPGTWEVFRVG